MVPTFSNNHSFSVIDMLTSTFKDENAGLPINAGTQGPEPTTIPFNYYIGIFILCFHPTPNRKIVSFKIENIVMFYYDIILPSIKLDSFTEFSINPFQSFSRFSMAVVTGAILSNFTRTFIEEPQASQTIKIDFG